MLQSKTPGVTILPGSGVPGTAGEIRIRGASSLSGYKPVVFIDGIRFNIDDLGGFSATGGGTAGLAQSTQVTSALNNLNPNDIESIEIIKGPAAATLYGAEAANGVIQIITKKGTRGQQAMRWNFKAETGSSTWKLLAAGQPQDLRRRVAGGDRVGDGHDEASWPGCQGVAVNTIISDNPLVARCARDPRLATSSDTPATFAAAATATRSTSPAIARREQGVFYNSDNNRTSIRSNFGFNPNEKSNFDDQRELAGWPSPPSDPGRVGERTPAERTRGDAGRDQPARRRATKDGRRSRRPRRTATRTTPRASASRSARRRSYNPIAVVPEPDDGRDSTTPSRRRSCSSCLATSMWRRMPTRRSGANFRSHPDAPDPHARLCGDAHLESDARAMKSTTLFGSQVVADKQRVRSGARHRHRRGGRDARRPAARGRPALEAYSENNSVGYYVQEQVDWNNRLFLTGAVRADDHSSFGTNFDLIVYPKLSRLVGRVRGAGAPSGFLDAARINALKLRGAWGQAGRAPTRVLGAADVHGRPRDARHEHRVPRCAPRDSAIRISKPERGTEIELGFDAGLFSERVGVDFTFYNKTTDDMLQSIVASRRRPASPPRVWSTWAR